MFGSTGMDFQGRTVTFNGGGNLIAGGSNYAGNITASRSPAYDLTLTFDNAVPTKTGTGADHRQLRQHRHCDRHWAGQ